MISSSQHYILFDLIVIVCLSAAKGCHITQHISFQLKASTHTIILVHAKIEPYSTKALSKIWPHTPKQHYYSWLEVSFYKCPQLLIPPLQTRQKCNSGHPKTYFVQNNYQTFGILLLLYTQQQSLGVYWIHPVRLSVYLSVCLSVR